MVTDEQVRLLRQKLMEGKKQETAAAAAGMSERSARTWQRGALPSETKTARTRRTREDRFAAIWDTEVVPLLESDEKGALQATTVLSWVQDAHPGQYGDDLLRTLQRRMRDWRALRGPEKEVFFEQQHVPGREAAFDFTNGDELGVTIAGQVFPHLLFELVLTYSGWTWVSVAFGKTFEAMAAGIQGALWDVGGVPAVLLADDFRAEPGDDHAVGRHREVREVPADDAAQPSSLLRNGIMPATLQVQVDGLEPRPHSLRVGVTGQQEPTTS